MELNIILAALLGWLLSYVLEISRKYKTFKSFKLKPWLNKQFWRILVSILCVVSGMLFTEDLLGVKITTFWAFIAAFSNDILLLIINDRKAKLLSMLGIKRAEDQEEEMVQKSTDFDHVCNSTCVDPCPKRRGAIRPPGSGGR